MMKKQHRHAFTTIEVLTVVVILAILMVLLFPMTKSITAKSKRAGCLQNLHDIGVALISYAGDHNNDLPYRSADQRYWYAPLTLAEALVGGKGSAGYLEWDRIGGTMCSKKLLCPADPNAEEWKKSLGYPRSYMYRQTDFSTAWEHQPMKLLLKTRLNHLEQGQENARRWLVTDRWSAAGDVTLPYPGKMEEISGHALVHPDNWTISSYWHKGGTNVLYEDGGVSWKPYGEILGK